MCLNIYIYINNVLWYIEITCEASCLEIFYKWHTVLQQIWTYKTLQLKCMAYEIVVCYSSNSWNYQFHNTYNDRYILSYW